MTLTNFPNGISVSGFASPSGAQFTIGDETSNEINVAIQLVDGAGNAMTVASAVNFYVSDASDATTIVAATTSLTGGTDGIVFETIANSAGMLVSEADGTVDVVIGDASGAATYYLALVMPSGELVVSDAITFAA